MKRESRVPKRLIDEYQPSSQGRKKAKCSKDNKLYEVEIVEVDKEKKKVKIHFKRATVTRQMSGVITMWTMFLFSGLKRCIIPMKTPLRSLNKINRKFYGFKYLGLTC